MIKRAILAAAATMLIAGSASAEELRIGFMNSMNHPLGKEQVNGFKLRLTALGWNKDGDMLGGVPTRVFYCDDQVKPDVGVTCAKKFVEQDKVQIVAGIVWSNILNAVRNPVVRNKVILMSTNAGSSRLAGVACSKYFISTSWQNDQTPEAMGQLMREEKLNDVYLMSANYQAGKDMMAGFRRFYNGRIKGQLLYKLGNRDFQSELTRVRAAQPSSVFVFAPGPMGVAFMKQWAASGLGKKIKLYTVFTIDNFMLLPIGKAAIGSFHTNYWDPDSKNPVNVKFIADYKAAYGRLPSHFATQAYDAPALIASAVKATGGKVNNTLALKKAMLKANYASVRGKYRYNFNGMPIQSYYKREVIAGPGGKAMIRTVGVVFTDHADSYAKRCKRSERMAP
ncbi:MAG TPA: ABC transporter substrate-binding protein [Alphaproteobacteria bacterium]|nr:ABC transporter substrate-binding protein [Alphaproteobacteria bacterium]